MRALAPARRLPGIRAAASAAAGPPARLAHHAPAGEVLELAARQRERFLRMGLHEEPFALLTANSIACAAALRAAEELAASVVLLPSPTLLPLAVRHARVDRCVGLDADGEPVVLEEGQHGGSRAREQDRRWLRSLHPPGGSASSSGACVVCTSGSGQAGPKLVAYRWAACRQQAAVTARRTLADAAPGGGRVRFVAASNMGHAYNLNGVFSALEADAELCVPRDSGELARTLAAEPPPDCESTVLFATPAMYRSLLCSEASLSGALRGALAASGRPLHAFSAGCPLPARTAAEARDRLGVEVLQNYGSSETGNIALQELTHGLAPVGNSAFAGIDVGTPWGQVELRPPSEGRLLPEGAEGEICTAVGWASEGYVLDGELVPHDASSFVRTGDAGRWRSSGGGRSLVVMQRLRPPLQLRRGGLRLLLQPYEVEAALLAADPSLTAAAALQGPDGQLHCAVEGPGQGGGGPAMEGPVQPDRLLRMEALPTSPAGKVLHSQIGKLFARAGGDA
uniref:AMP-dependent synthetase/ligase domain-containing protein n=1 Tax=Alexandrium monilatum TaxID=311494 RepID=A0A7S4QTW4_9DINO